MFVSLGSLVYVGKNGGAIPPPPICLRGIVLNYAQLYIYVRLYFSLLLSTAKSVGHTWKIKNYNTWV
jgi:hypothetical protein